MKTKATIALLGLALPLAAGAQESIEKRQEGIEKTLETILSKAGLSVGGRATGEFLQSELKGSARVNEARQVEPVTYTQVDFDFRARPNTVTTARAVFRLHLDWPNFFGSPYTPFETRWLSIDGRALDNMLYYSAGDMSVRWSPYTIHGNDVGFLYTPRIFSQLQEQAMGERFLGNNVRNLQGAQMGIRAAVPAVQIDSFNVGAIASKLANASAGVDNPAKQYPFSLAEFDRWAMGGRFDVAAMGGLGLGATFLTIRDLRSSYQDQSENYNIERNRAQIGNIWAARAGVQADKLVALPVQVGLDFEYAGSNWDLPLRADTLTRRTVKGMGLATDLKLGYQMDKMLDARISAGFMMNDSGFRNDLAQSPTFFGRIILNTEQIDTGSLPKYSTFNALYRNVHRFVPEKQTNQMIKNPIEKVAYTNQVIGSDSAEVANLDPVLQTVLPGGNATANRVGPRFGLDIGLLDGAINLVGNGWILSEDKATAIDTTNGDEVKVKYSKYQFGGRVRAEKFLGDLWTLPIELSASYELNSAKGTNATDFTANVLNAGAYIGVYKRVALLFGYQTAVSEDKAYMGSKYNQSNLGAGVEYKVTEGSYLDLVWNRVTAEAPDVKVSGGNSWAFAQNIINARLTVGF